MGREMERGEKKAGWWQPAEMYLSFQVSVHHSGIEDEFTASEIHPCQGVFTVNINICVCAVTRATLDKPTAVNYELACREGDRPVNMQSWGCMVSSCNTSVRPSLHLQWPGLTWVSINSTGLTTAQELLGMGPKNCCLTDIERNFQLDSCTKKVTKWPFLEKCCTFKQLPV